LFLGREVSRTQPYSEETARRIDAEVARILREAYESAMQILRENREKLDLLARLLVERETLSGSDVEDVVKFGRIRSEQERSEPPPLTESAAPTSHAS
jgi:cell division protease FtsH